MNKSIEHTLSWQNDTASGTVGCQIGRYEILEELGRGAMGIVYKAHDPILDRWVALKVLRFTSGARQEELEQRFRREAQAIGKLSHPNIVQVHDAGVAENQWYMAMEYLEGKTLAKVIEQGGAQPLARVGRIVTQVCEALDYAHGRQIVHRDVKPSNIMLVENDRVKVTDFGLASIASDPSLPAEDLSGTLGYMSPEQIKEPGRVDGRSDIFSLGAVVCELLTGKVLFPDEPVTPIHLITSPSPVDLGDLGLSDLARRVLEKALAKQANERFSTCAEFAESFDRAVKGPTVHTTVAIREPALNAVPEKEGTTLERYALAYRAAEASQVMGWIKAGQSGCILGLSGGGKSNLLRFLLRENVRQHYLGQDCANFALVLIDLLALTECTEWAVCELILDRLLAQLGVLGIDEKIIGEMASVHHDVIRSKDLTAAYRALERCMGILCRQPAQHVAILFNYFDSAFQTLNPPLFHCLRAIRDTYKDQVSYVIAVTNDLISLRDNLDEVEPFYYLVSRNICYLGPLNETDTRYRIRFLAAQQSVEMSDQDTTRLIKLCGGYPSLLKAILDLLWDLHQEKSLAEIAPTLLDEPAVQTECRKVWKSLSESEQTALCALACGAQADLQMLHRLKRRGVVRQDQSETLIFSPLFADFVRRQALPFSTIGIVISRSPQRVQIDGRCIEALTELEFEMLCYLYEHRGQVCTKDELIANVYHQQYDRMAGGVTDEALQTLMARLRAKIDPDGKQLRYIVTVRGEGYKFVKPGER
jgi:tRNA A-37 threonylcarbamoyl transferase component Bud32